MPKTKMANAINAKIVSFFDFILIFPLPHITDFVSFSLTAFCSLSASPSRLGGDRLQGKKPWLPPSRHA
jgi:hypothetical protein